jgi:DNA-binding response OmpR family regulator
MKVLYVTDNPSDEYERHLICANYRVSSVGGIKDANNALKEVKYDVILVDLDWGTDGKSLCGVSELKKSSTPVVVLARNRDLGALRECDGAGITDYLIKDGLSGERLIARLEFVVKKTVKNAEAMAALSGSKKRIKLSKKTMDELHPFICLGA